MFYRIATAILAGTLAAGTAVAQTTPSTSSTAKGETNCATTGSATAGKGEDKTNTSMAIGNSAILPEAGGANSAAPTVQADGKPMVASTDCPPDAKAK